ncbi:MAG: signal transduction histidine kinase [Candidatus Atelocyanobacterium thalassa isolate SIO64986]|uniref:histidine kinase n=1 Tax=Candidatus Atelocyanobacterium thalassa isolate SIO64986 TaxID=1527444 RepID=A0A086CI94_9CHRO|nr:MAG: signal transduction histidine kinase [Candidatus Atelocyanobacterium thalassa isolate SIO64986]
MFSATAKVSYPSSDFISLCQSQITLLAKILQAEWSAVYLTSEKDNQQINFIPIVVYPAGGTARNTFTNHIDFIKGKEITAIPIFRGSLSSISEDLSSVHNSNFFTSEPYQVGFPLVYEGLVLGVLVTRRFNHPWKQDELTQIKKIANTLAIARSLDQRQASSKKQLHQQKILHKQEYDRLENLFHQLRNPLTALKIFGKLLLKRLISDEQSFAVVKNIVREGEHLHDLIQEFETNQISIDTSLDTVPLNSNFVGTFKNSLSPLLPSQSLELDEIYISEILEDILISMKPIAQNKNIILQIHAPNYLQPVLASIFGLREVISNLIDNSIKYTPPFGRIDIRLGLFKIIDNKQYQGICIQDTGLGISTEDQPYIFERHYRGAKTQESILGNGLGLSIVKELVDKMNGTIELLSPIDFQNNKGTQFIVWLSLKDSRYRTN